MTFEHAAMERAFVERFGSSFVEDRSGDVASFVGPAASVSRRDWKDGAQAWLVGNAPIGSVSSGPTDEGYTYRVEARYEDSAAELARDWGHVFRAGPDGRTFTAQDYPSPPARTVPAGFMAYLKGEAETYDAPHLPATLDRRGDRVPTPTSP